MIHKTTEQSSNYNDLELKSSLELLEEINAEDQKVASAVKLAIPAIKDLVDQLYEQISRGGRLFYIGAGTSGRLGILDASECPPTFGVDHNVVIGIIAGGDTAIRKAVENAEDDTNQAILDLQNYDINKNDIVVGIAASGTTPYVIGGLRDCQAKGIKTGAIACNPDAPIFDYADYPILAEVGPEYVTGSTRMKSGTAQKMILNMITTSVMILIGRVKGNKMVDMQLSNDKLIARGIQMIISETNCSFDHAAELLEEFGHVRTAVEEYRKLKGTK